MEMENIACVGVELINKRLVRPLEEFEDGKIWIRARRKKLEMVSR